MVSYWWKICEEGNKKLKSRVEEKNGRLRLENISSGNLKKENIELNKNDVKIQNINGQKEEILKKMLKDADDEAKREEIIHMLLEQKVSKVIKEEKIDKKKLSYKFSNFVGSREFVVLMIMFVALWVGINILFLVIKQFNPYSFVILNVVLSCFMLIFCSLIVFNQNKKKKIDEKKSENDYKVNLKNEIIIEDLHYKLDDLIEKQNEIAKRVSELETKKKVPPVKEKRAYKFIDISEHDTKKNK